RIHFKFLYQCFRIFFIFTPSLYTGIGTIGTAMPGVFVRCEKFLRAKRLLFLIISSAAMLKLI
ncbi:hypothetical protein, partial [uncultured Campylobacter sp.]|uniref:hypothetical protein n=1 Tax=uncultured Campylobacter sp. TaxID=218934 RepID=UPI00260CB12D